MKRCPDCQVGSRSGPLPNLGTGTSETSREVAGHLFVAFIPMRRCASCADVAPDHDAIQRFELHVALHLAESGIATGEAFRFMRKAIRMRASELAHWLDLAPETVSRWETDKRSVDRGALAILGNLVRDAVEGRTATLQGLRALHNPQPLDRTVRIDLDR